MVMYDLIIVGGGPAGLTAAIYALRRTLKALVISKEFGGVPVNVPIIENYPGFKRIDGMSLMKEMEEQTKASGAEIVYGEEVKQITEEKDGFTVNTEKKEYKSKAVILAFGRTPRHLEVPGDKEFDGKGVSYCVNCDGPLFKDEVVCVVGGGNAALDAALVMSEIGKKVYLIHRRDKFRAFESFVKNVKTKNNVKLIMDSVVKEFKGGKMLKSVVIENINTKEQKELKVTGAFVEIGSVVKTEFLENLIKTDDNNLIVTDNKCRTFYPDSNKIKPGIFAAGDVTNNPFKQIVVATGQGAIAALGAYNYIKGLEGEIYVDWGHKEK